MLASVWLDMAAGEDPSQKSSTLFDPDQLDLLTLNSAQGQADTGSVYVYAARLLQDMQMHLMWDKLSFSKRHRL